MGRKPISDERKSERTLRIRLTDAEREQLDAAATSAGVPTSTWARGVLIDAAAKADEK